MLRVPGNYTPKMCRAGLFSAKKKKKNPRVIGSISIDKRHVLLGLAPYEKMPVFAPHITEFCQGATFVESH